MANKQSGPTQAYKGRSIKFRPEHFDFEVTGPGLGSNGDDDDDDTVRHFSSAADARAAIDAIEKNKAATRRRKLDLHVMAPEGTEHHVTGIHASNLTLLATPKLNAYNPRVYPNAQMIRTALKRIASLNDEVGRLQHVLSSFEVEAPNRRHSRGYKDDDIAAHENAVKEFESSINKALKSAEKADLDVLLSKIKPGTYTRRRPHI